MRILQVTPSFPPVVGGVEKHVQAMSEALFRRGHSVVVATMVKDASLPRHEQLDGIEIHRFSAWGPAIYPFPIGLLHYLRVHGLGFDVIHAHNYYTLPPMLAALVRPERTIITPHLHGAGRSRGAKVLHLRRLYDPLAIVLIRRARGVVCDSAGEVEIVAQRLGLVRENIIVIPSIIKIPNATGFVSENSENYDVDGGNFLLSVGRLENYKRVDRVIASLPYLPDEYTLAVIGTGPERSKLEETASRAGVHHRVRFLGQVADDDLKRWYQRAQTVVSLSEAEAFGRTVVEALSFGCPVVCSDIPSYRNFSTEFPDSVSLVSPHMHPAEVAAVLQASMAKPKEIPAEVQRYSWSEVGAQLERIYKQVADANERTVGYSRGSGRSKR